MLTARPEPTRGSVLMLMPAAILIVFLLAAIAVDLSLVFLRQREATSHAVDLANDVATVGLDQDAFRSGRDLQLVDDASLQGIARDLAVSRIGGELVAVDARSVGPVSVEITVVLRADYVFARALPGEADSTEVTATATGEAQEG